MKRTLKDIFLFIPIPLGIISLLWMLLDRSEEKNMLILGLSAFRLALAGIMILGIALSVLFWYRRRFAQRYLYYLGGAAIILSGELLIFSRFPSDDSRNLIPLTGERAEPLLIWLLLSGIFWLLAMAVSEQKKPEIYGFWLTAIAVAVYWPISTHIDRYNWMIDLRGNTAMCLAVLGMLGLWCLAMVADIGRGWKTFCGFLFFVVLGYSVTHLTGLWMGRANTPSSAYWNELAEAMLQGRLDLINPSGFHDLTEYNGKWFVPNPPLPGILLIPWVALLGSAEAINMTVYSAVVAGINAGLFFLMLILAFTHERSPLRMFDADENLYPENSLAIAVWVTVLFIFGTDHLWLGTTGQMWFISQLLVVTFTLLGCIFALCQWPPVMIGISLGCAVLCRPNVFPIYLCLLGIYLWQQREFPRIDWKKTIVWALKSGIPVVIVVGLLLVYNKVRFDDWMDFGYVTINGADWILDSVQKYGMFNLHFFPINADVMLFGLPRLDFTGRRFFFQPYVAGYSIFLMTPPIIYAFRSLRKNWFSIGTWASVLLSVALLLLYHNTGAEQIGYRYMLDFAVPLALLTADGMHGKAGRLFKVLTIFAVCLSFIAIYWWYLGRV